MPLIEIWSQMIVMPWLYTIRVLLLCRLDFCLWIPFESPWSWALDFLLCLGGGEPELSIYPRRKPPIPSLLLEKLSAVVGLT